MSGPNTTKQYHDFRVGPIEVVVVAMQGWRPSMEDTYVVELEEGVEEKGGTILVGVFDGHGGGEVANYCEENWTDCVKQDSDLFESDLPQAMRSACFMLDARQKQALVDADILRRASRMFMPPHCYPTRHQLQIKSDIEEATKELALGEWWVPMCAGSTAITAAIRGSRLVVANVGDSRAVLCRKGGLAVACSKDHKTSDPTEYARIVAAGSWVSVGRVEGDLAMSRAIGDFRFKYRERLGAEDQAVTCAPDVTQFELDPDDEFLILASDGIWDVMCNQVCVDFVRKGLAKDQSLHQVMDSLLDECLRPSREGRGSTDNMTCLVVKFK